jgi:hypothetical protein
MASDCAGRIPSLGALAWASPQLPVEEALDATFPVRRPLEWLYLPPRSVSGLGLARALPLETSPLALRRGRLVARDGRGRIYLVDSRSSPSLPLTVNAARPGVGKPLSIRRVARREARLIAAYEGSRASAQLAAGRVNPRLEILASLYYLVVLCDCDAYSLILDEGGGCCPFRGKMDGSRPGASRFSGAGESFLTSRCRCFRPSHSPAASSSSRRVPS